MQPMKHMQAPWINTTYVSSEQCQQKGASACEHVLQTLLLNGMPPLWWGGGVSTCTSSPAKQQ